MKQAAANLRTPVRTVTTAGRSAAVNIGAETDPED